MFSKDSLVKIKTLKENSRQSVELMEDKGGKKYIKRTIFGDKRKVYRALNKINHPNIPKVHLVEFTSDTVVYEDFVDGILLTDFMEKNKSLGKKEINSIATGVLSAIEVLHGAGIIHRDIKPDNIIIGESFHIWLTDYDISRIYENEIKRDTETAGTFGYAPIEQYGMLPTDFKTDIYSFGVTLSTLLDCFGINGYMRRVAGKCKKLDPAERYRSAKKVKNALIFGRFRFLLATVVLALTAAGFFIGFSGTKTTSPANKSHSGSAFVSSDSMAESSPDSALTADASNQKSDGDIAVIPEGVQSEDADNLQREDGVISDSVKDFEGDFYGFGYGENEEVYQNYNNYSDICVFSMSKPWEHLIFADDINKKGRLKLGVENTVLDADISLFNGVLSVILTDTSGNRFNKDFKNSAQSGSGDDSKVNADLICYDFDGDGGNELLIGLSRGVTGTGDDYFYSNVNYCLGWCIRYDKTAGFTLCDGEMVSEDCPFWVNTDIRKLNVSWEDFDDITGYVLEGSSVIPVR